MEKIVVQKETVERVLLNDIIDQMSKDPAVIMSEDQVEEIAEKMCKIDARIRNNEKLRQFVFIAPLVFQCGSVFFFLLSIAAAVWGFFVANTIPEGNSGRSAIFLAFLVLAVFRWIANNRSWEILWRRLMFLGFFVSLFLAIKLGLILFLFCALNVVAIMLDLMHRLFKYILKFHIGRTQAAGL